MEKKFPVINLQRNDIEAVGFRSNELSDVELSRIAARVGNILLDDAYWIALSEACEDILIYNEDGEDKE